MLNDVKMHHNSVQTDDETNDHEMVNDDGLENAPDVASDVEQNIADN